MDQNLIAFPVAPGRRAMDRAPEPAQSGLRQTLRRHLFVAVALCTGLFTGAGGWFVLAAVSGNTVESAEAGHAVAVSAGAAGLEETDDRETAAARLAVIVQQINELTVRKARLLAERDGAETIRLPVSMERRLGADGGLLLMAGEDALFRVRRKSRRRQQALLRQRIARLGDEIGGLEQQQRAIRQELRLTRGERQGLPQPGQQELPGIDHSLPLERAIAQLEGRHGRLVAEIARVHGRINAAEMQIAKLEENFRDTVIGELVSVRQRLVDLSERRIAMEDRLRRARPEIPGRDLQRMTAHGAPRSGGQIKAR